ncbi:hypothetical protein HOY82DRAFT_588918 [Tuber indicum]|nr:hypothetical protein HOY82DRAFT_588918 [Tuber indicum]
MMTTGSSEFTNQAQRPERNMIPGQLAILETVRAIWTLVGEDPVEDFVVIGGAALLFYGGDNRTEDVDVAITSPTLRLFEEAAEHDHRFVPTPGDAWEYTSSFDIIVHIDFLDKSGSGGPLHKLRGYTLFDGIPVATLPDLAVGKGTAWVNRKLAKDFKGLEYVVRRMARQAINFRGLDSTGIERLDDIMEGLRCTEPGRKLARLITTLR